jgi:dihydroxyacetone kinase-like predicted kinase
VVAAPDRSSSMAMMPSRAIPSQSSSRMAPRSLLDQLVGPEHEIVTIIEGEGATAVVTRHLEVWLHDNRPDCDVEVHHGGQPLYPYLFGIE